MALLYSWFIPLEPLQLSAILLLITLLFHSPKLPTITFETLKYVEHLRDTNLNLIIAVATAVTHLIGTHGKPSWLLNRFESGFSASQAPVTRTTYLRL